MRSLLRFSRLPKPVYHGSDEVPLPPEAFEKLVTVSLSLVLYTLCHIQKGNHTQTYIM